MQFGYDEKGILVDNDAYRFMHTYVIGKTGMGKSTLIKRGILQDIYAGHGVCFVTAHEDDVYDLLPYIPPERRRDVILFDPTDRRFPKGLNIFCGVPKEHHDKIITSMLDIVQALWHYKIPTPTMDQGFMATTAALVNVPNATILSIFWMLLDSTYRERVLSHVKDKFVLAFWDDFNEMNKKEQRQERASTLNKIFRFAIDENTRNIVGQSKPKLKFKDIMNDKKILLVPLPSELGEKQASFIGAFLLTQLHIVGLTRPKDYRPPFNIYIDEFHKFVFGSTPEMFSGLRKFQVSLTVAHQYVDQLTDEMRKAVFGTAGTMVAFGLGPEDAPTLSPSFDLRHRDGEPVKSLLTELKPFQAHVRTPVGTHYSVQTADISENEDPKLDYPTYPPSRDFQSVYAQLQHESRMCFARPVDEVEREIDNLTDI